MHELLAAGGFRPVRTLAERDGLIFIEAQPKARRPPRGQPSRRQKGHRKRRRFLRRKAPQNVGKAFASAGARPVDVRIRHATPVLVRRTTTRPAKSRRPPVCRESEVLAALGRRRRVRPHADAVRIGRHCRRGPHRTGSQQTIVLDLFSGPRTPEADDRCAAGPFEHAARRRFPRRRCFVATLGLTPAARHRRRSTDSSRCGSSSSRCPGPGGGGGGGGLRQKAPPPKAEREGRRDDEQPAPGAEPPKPVEPARPARARTRTAQGGAAADRRRATHRGPCRPRSRTGVLEQTAARERQPRIRERWRRRHGRRERESAKATARASARDPAAAPAAASYRPGSGIEPPSCCARSSLTTPKTRGCGGSRAKSSWKSSSGATDRSAT